MRIELVANAKSGSGTDREDIAAALRRHGATVSDDAPERIVVAGGDGTLGGAADRARTLGVPLAVIPTGTANDFARAHGLSDDFDEAVALAATGADSTSLELGYAGDIPFLNVAATGLAPRAARRAEPLKRVLGPLAYPVGALVSALRDRPVRCAVDADGERVFEGEAWQLMVACSGAFGGGAVIDAADPQDGRLDLVVVPAGRRIALVRYGVVLRQGHIADLPDTVHARAGELALEVPQGTSFNVDGEVVELGGRVAFSAHRDAVRLITPAS